MKPVTAIRTFMNLLGVNEMMTYPPVSMTEIREFKESMPREEFVELATQACKIMDVELEPV